MNEKILFSITEIGEKTAIKVEATPTELVTSFSALIVESDFFRAILQTAFEMSKDHGFVEELKESKIFFQEGDIKPQGYA